MITMSHRALPRSVACVAFVALTASARAQAPMHVESDAGWSHGSVSNGALDARLAAAARQYRNYAPVPRIAFFDLAYPKRSEEHTSELQSQSNLVCRLLLEKKKKTSTYHTVHT